MKDIWRPVLDALDGWFERGAMARLWLRDDDAIDPSPALDRLLELTAQFAVPLVLAIIPANTGPELALKLQREPHAHPAVHGWAHRNHAPEGEKRQELGPHRPLQVLQADCRQGIARLRELYGDRLISLLVPPWNRIAPALIPHLPLLGYVGVSAFGWASPRADLAVVNAHVDLIDWRGARRCRDKPAIASALAHELVESGKNRGEPIGLLSHHLIDDPACLAVLQEIFTVTGDHPGCRWIGPAELVNGAVARRLPMN